MRRSGPALGRRALLAGIAATVVGTVEARGTQADTTLDPTARLTDDFLYEAVLDDAETTAYVATRDGFAVVDVTDPRNPSVRSRVTDVLADVEDGPLELIIDARADDDRVVVCGPGGGEASGFTGFAVFDASDPDAPERVAHRRMDHAPHNAYLDGDYVYTTSSSHGVEPFAVWDVSGDPERVATWTPAGHGWPRGICHDMFVRDDTMYLCYWDLGTWLLDVSDPADPTPRVRLGFDPAAVDDPAETMLPGNAHYAMPNDRGDLLAIGREAFDRDEPGIRDGPGGIGIWEVSDPLDAERVALLAAPDVETAGRISAHNFDWRGDRLYTSWHSAGVRVYDLTAPAEPRVVGEWRDPDATTFWTARTLPDGFLATSIGPPAGRKGPAELFTFPEPSDEGYPAPQAEPVAPMAALAPDEYPTATPSATATASPTDSATATRSATDVPVDSPTEGATTESASPGFGPLAGGVAAALAGYRLTREE